MTQYIFFASFLVFILLMLALDLGVFHKKDHVVGIKEATIWTLIWIALSMVMAMVVRIHAEWIHGISSMDDLWAYAAGTNLEEMLNPQADFATNLNIYRNELCHQYLAGYFLEKSLSIDNIFVMILIFVSFGIDKKYYHRILFWGILGAIVLRFIFIFALGAIVERFSWVLAIFGVILLYSGVKMMKDDDDEQIDTENHPVVKFCSRYLRATPKTVGHSFFARIDGKLFITPLFIVLMVIEFSDVIFAVDSIPAVFSVTTDSYIVFFSNIFAILGLRSIFFLLSGVKDTFWLLNYGLGILLCFVGVKMLLAQFFHYEIDTIVSLGVTLGILVVSMLGSVIFPHPKSSSAEKE